MSNDKTDDPINPSHYKQGKIEVIDFLDDQNLNFRLSSAIKYICRSPYKGTQVEDLRKAIWYLNREIEYLNDKNQLKYSIKKDDWKYTYGSVVPETEIQSELPLKFEEVETKDVIEVSNRIEKLPLIFTIGKHTRTNCPYNGCYKCITMGVESAD